MSVLNSTKALSIFCLSLLATACGGGGSSPETNNNIAPVVNAGNDQTVNESTELTLTGSASDADGTIASYNWTQTAGTTVNLTNASSSEVSFTSPDVSADETLTFRLTATDNQGLSSSDDVTVTVLNINQLPTADAGADQSALGTEIITLNGQGIDPDGSISSYVWLQTAGEAVSLTAADTANASFTAPQLTSDQTLTFQLTVTDNDGGSATDSVDIHIQAEVLLTDLSFSDGGLRNCVRDFAESNGLLYVSQITELSCVFKDIRSLAGIENLSALTYLDLNANVSIGDLSPLANITRLQTLLLGGNDIEDISALASLSELRRLHLHPEHAYLGTVYNRVTDLSPLAELQHIHDLDLRGNQITDITVLQQLPMLTTLNLTNNPLANLSDIGTLTNLTTLTLNNYSNFDLNILAELVNISELEIENSGLSDLSVLANFTALEKLRLGSNQISDLSPLSHANMLLELNLFNNQIEDLAPLSGLTTLTELSLGLNQITDVSALSHLTALTHLRLEANNVLNGEPLLSLTQLLKLYLSGNNNITCTSLNALSEQFGDDVVFRPNNCSATSDLEITELAFADANLKTCVLNTAQSNDWSLIGEMSYLSCTNAKINDLAGLDDLTSLTELDLSNNLITTTDAIGSLTQLTSLNLSNNIIGKIAGLDTQTQLTSLDISGNNEALCEHVSTLEATYGSEVVTAPDSCFTPMNIEDMTFTDSRMRACARYMAQEEEWTTSDEVTFLNCWDMSISNIEGIGLFPYLKRVGISKNSISDISPLADLKMADTLYISQNDIRDISPLSSLKLVRELDLADNPLTDVYPQAADTDAPILDLSHLEILKLGGTELASTASFAKVNFSGLEQLYLYHLDLNDISGLEGLSKLITLDLSFNQLTNVSPLSALTSLRQLKLDRNNISDLSPLSGLIGLTQLHLYVNQVSDMAPLAPLKNLTRIGLSTNAISEFTNLQGLDFSHISELDLAYNQITDTSGLEQADWSGLTKLILNNNQMENINGLTSMTALESLELRTNKLSDISPLAGLTQLSRLLLNSNEIEDISPLSNLTKLDNLNIEYNALSNIDALAALTLLYELQLVGNQIEDISVLADLQRVSFLYLSNNNISDISPLNQSYNLRSLRLDGNSIPCSDFAIFNDSAFVYLSPYNPPGDCLP